ncbi:phosphatase PAP2 family protein [Noviherbaspirillum sp. UKPF54]|uniref:phosphatase PAP2 family protein n=1 Tax=Noviherbaspirillum sp. UKPF54 TaxID=2601898 RepID=UPI0011B12737|nr:phosphatase PAP2 family protein [Noviherbaspirillum sp. UKPF54]QDZ29191.1 phosphatase PAP2 family protein [Noviherbaspirillum sp. UKPF54]
MISWTHITQFGDVTITMLVAFAIAAWLYIEGERRLALWWSGLFTAGLGIVVVTKMAFIGWGIGVRALDFTGFSGHAMRATAVIPVLFYLMLQKTAPALRAAGVLAGFAGAVLIGLSRLTLHAHSVSEVVAGTALGAAVSMAFIWIAAESLRRHVFNPLRIALSMLALLPAPYLHPAPTQQWLTGVSLFFSGHDKPFMRTGARDAQGPGRTELSSRS